MVARYPSPKNHLIQRMPFALASAGFGLVLILWFVPQWQVNQLPTLDKTRLQQLPLTEQLQLQLEDTYQRAQAEREQRNTLILIALGLWGGMAIYFSWQNHHSQHRQQDTSEFRKAVELLAAKDKIEVRLGGIYLLEQIASDSPGQQAIVLEVLTAYIREHSTKVGDTRHLGSNEVNTLRVPTDIQAALTVIARCHSQFETSHLDFQDAYLIQANLIQANFQGANFQGTYLIGTNLREADLREANLRNADLLSANLSGADLTQANLSSANLLGTNLNSANFQNADLTGANLRGAYLGNANLLEANLNSADLIGVYLSDANLSQAKLIGANLRTAKLIGTQLTNTDLSEANFTGADLSDASLVGADFTDANLREVSFQRTQFREADLSGADLRGAIFLEVEQLVECKLCRTKLPEHLDLDANRDCASLKIADQSVASQ